MKEVTAWVPIFRICGALTLIVTSMILIPQAGFIGAAYSVLSAFILMSLVIYYKTYKIYPVPYNWKGLLYPIFVLLVVQIYELNLFLKFFASILYPILWYFAATTKNEKNGIKRFLKW